MVVLPFWTRDMCDAVIRAAEAAGGFEPNPDDPVPGHEISLATISPRLYENVMVDLGMRVWPQLQRKWPLIDYCGLRDAFIIKYDLDGQRELRLHHDVAQLSASVKLNDGYTGRRTRFPAAGFPQHRRAGGVVVGVAEPRDSSAPVVAIDEWHQVFAHDLVRDPRTVRMSDGYPRFAKLSQLFFVSLCR